MLDETGQRLFEQQLIARCVGSLLDQTYPRDLYRVVVIADNCSDETAARAAAAGASTPENPMISTTATTVALINARVISATW